MLARLIGSVALYKGERESTDTDIVCDAEWSRTLIAANPHKILKAHGPYCYSLHGNNGFVMDVKVPEKSTAHYALLGIEAEETTEVCGLSIGIPTLSVLAALKKAHLILPRKWKNHIESYGEIKKRLGVMHWTPECVQTTSLYTKHREECLALAKKHPKLSQPKDDFFQEEAYNIFDHDSIHQAAALGPKPAYTFIKSEHEEVWCDMDKWDRLPHTARVACVVEEACVLALERAVIPSLFSDLTVYSGAENSYKYALYKICTTITSGWFRDFAIEAYQEAVWCMPKYIDKLFEGLKDGTVRHYSKPVRR